MMNRFRLDYFYKHFINFLIIGIIFIPLFFSCTNQSIINTVKPDQQSGILMTSSAGRSSKTAIANLPAVPRGWVEGTEGWIPPLPPGLDQPRTLTYEEWEMVDKIASQDQEVSKQRQKDNVGKLVHCWVGYSGGPGFSNKTELDISSGKIDSPIGYWYYPAIEYIYITRTDRNGQLIGVDISTNQIVLSNGKGLEAPRKPRPY
jgi:hypothetical protein